jgi:hypothetical protein
MILLIVSATRVNAQVRIVGVPVAADPESAVAAYIGRTVAHDKILDPRMLRVSAGPAGEEFGPPWGERAAALAALSRAELARFEVVVACRDHLPEDGPIFPIQLCQMPAGMIFFGISTPNVSGDSADVFVTTWKGPTGVAVTHPTVVTVRYIVRRHGGGWSVDARRVEATT